MAASESSPFASREAYEGGGAPRGEGVCDTPRCRLTPRPETPRRTPRGVSIRTMLTAARTTCDASARVLTKERFVSFLVSSCINALHRQGANTYAARCALFCNLANASTLRHEVAVVGGTSGWRQLGTRRPSAEGPTGRITNLPPAVGPDRPTCEAPSASIRGRVRDVECNDIGLVLPPHAHWASRCTGRWVRAQRAW